MMTTGVLQHLAEACLLLKFAEVSPRRLANRCISAEQQARQCHIYLR